MTSRSTRELILDAAERLFAQRGAGAVSMAEVCRAARTSNGSLFHFFPTKDALAGALYVRALDAYQRAILSGLPRASSARAGLRGLVLRHVAWVEANLGRARLLHEQRHTSTGPGRAVEDEIRALNGALLRRLTGWLEPHVTAGRVRRLAPEVLLAVLLGPVYTLTRVALGDGSTRRLRAAARALADAAWVAVADRAPPPYAQPTDARSHARGLRHEPARPRISGRAHRPEDARRATRQRAVRGGPRRAAGPHIQDSRARGGDRRRRRG